MFVQGASEKLYAGLAEFAVRVVLWPCVAVVISTDSQSRVLLLCVWRGAWLLFMHQWL